MNVRVPVSDTSDNTGLYGGAVLGLSAIAALVVANSPLGADYEALLRHYVDVLSASATLGQKPQADLAAKAVRAADRWRALDPDSPAACDLASRVLMKESASPDEIGEALKELTAQALSGIGLEAPFAGMAATVGKPATAPVTPGSVAATVVTQLSRGA